jgi:quercetin dioxygenase-like cupin family protein
MTRSITSFAIIALVASALQVPATAQTRGIKVTPVIKTSKTVVEQPLSYITTSKPEVTSVVQTYEPGGETGWHYHLTASHIYVLEGTLTLEVYQGKTFTFNPGEAYMESVKVFHNARNLTDKPLKLLVVTFGEQSTSNNVFGIPAQGVK